MPHSPRVARYLSVPFFQYCRLSNRVQFPLGNRLLVVKSIRNVRVPARCHVDRSGDLRDPGQHLATKESASAAFQIAKNISERAYKLCGIDYATQRFVTNRFILMTNVRLKYIEGGFVVWIQCTQSSESGEHYVYFASVPSDDVEYKFSVLFARIRRKSHEKKYV